jgi:hypothetical protein
MRKMLRLTAGVALAAAFTFGADGAALAAPAPDASCVALAGAIDRTLYFPLGAQVSAIAQDPGNFVPGAGSLGEIIGPLATGEFPCPV